MRFYPGTTIAYWRHEVSVSDVRLCLRAIPRLEARESLLASARIAVGTGSLKKGAAKDIQRRWERDANGGRAMPRERRPPDPRALGALGIKVTRKVQA